MKTPDEADSTEPVLVISLTASERSTDARACPWTRVEPCVTGLVASFQTLDEQAQPVRLGVETVGRAFYSIKDTIFAKYSERYSLRRPSELVGLCARRRASATLRKDAQDHTGVIGAVKGLTVVFLRLTLLLATSVQLS